MDQPNSGTTTQDAVRDFVSELDDPSTPFTVEELADRDTDPDEITSRDLQRLVASNELQTRELAGGHQVWWQPAEKTNSATDQAKLQEFGAFVSAVKDYAIFMLDPDGTVVSWNQGARRIKG